MHTNGTTGVSESEFRRAMSAVCSPVSIVTTSHAGRHHGTTVSAFMSLSLKPSAVLISLANDSTLLSMVKISGYLGLNVLGAGQSALAQRFATKSRDKFDNVEFELDHGLPRLPGTIVWARCRVTNVVNAYDHGLLYCVLEDVSVTDSEPLLYHNQAFTRPRMRHEESLEAARASV